MAVPESQKRWTAENTKRHTIKFMTRTEADILEWLDRQPNRQGAIKKAIREYIANHPET